jgi:hypothetical protein
MDSKEIRHEFFRSIRRVDRSTYRRETTPAIDKMRELHRKLETVVVSSGPNHVLRRRRDAV